MKKKNKNENEVFLRAGNLIALGREEFSCNAIDAQEVDGAMSLFRKLVTGSQGGWVSIENMASSPGVENELYDKARAKRHRLMALAMAHTLWREQER